MPNILSKQAYVQGLPVNLYCFKNQLTRLNAWILMNKFTKGQQKIPIKNIRVESNRAVHSRQKRSESALSQNHSVTSKSADKRIKRYVDRPPGESKTCLIHSTGHSSDECNVLRDFGAEYVKVKPTKDQINHPAPRQKVNSQQENISIVNGVVDEILLHKTKKSECCEGSS